jgi:hypothetical protein
MRNYEKANLRDCILSTFEKSGYKVKLATITRTDEVRAAKTGFKDAKGKVKEQNISDIVNASNEYIGKPTVRLAMDANYADQCAILKAQWCDRLPGLLDPESMSDYLLHLVVYDAPRIVQGMEKLVLAENPHLLKVIGKSRLDKTLERNSAIPWSKSNQYLECKLLAAIGIGNLVDAFLSQRKLTKDDAIVQDIHSKLKGTISIDGVKGRGSHFLKRSIPEDPIKLASLMLSKVGIPHNVKNDVISIGKSIENKIKPYIKPIKQSVKQRLEAIVQRILDRDVPVTPVTVFAVTPNSPQTHTGQGLQSVTENNFFYKSPMDKKTDNVLPLKEQQKTEVLTDPPTNANIFKECSEPLTIEWDEIIRANDDQVISLGWDGVTASQKLLDRYGVKSRLKLTDAQLWDWINYCQELVGEAAIA